MLSTSLESILSLCGSDLPDEMRYEMLKQAAYALFREPDAASQLVAVIMSRTDQEAELSEAACMVLSSTLDEARMAYENGIQAGGDFIAAVGKELSAASNKSAMSLVSSFAFGRIFTEASLQAPESLIVTENQLDQITASAARDAELGDFGPIESLFDVLFGDYLQDDEMGISELHSMFASMLPAFPGNVRKIIVRTAIRRNKAVYQALGCAWLLDVCGYEREGAVQGLQDLIAKGQLSGDTLNRLTVIRSWVSDKDHCGRIDDLIRSAMRTRKGLDEKQGNLNARILKVVTSGVDGAGAQSFAASVEASAGRGVAVVLLKEGYGVKDAYVIPCTSAADQKRMLAMIAEESGGMQVAASYFSTALGFAMGEGLSHGRPPIPGLIDVASSCGMHDLRPLEGTIDALLSYADPKALTATLSSSARNKLIGASDDWELDYPVLTSWFEDNDTITQLLNAAKTGTARKKAVWSYLEERRFHWARLIARMALVADSTEGPVLEFVAVARAILEKQDLKKIAIMQVIHDRTIFAWEEQNSSSRAMMAGETLGARSAASKEPAALTDAALAKLMKSAGLRVSWLDGYLVAICVAPKLIMPGEWIQPLFDVIGPYLKDNQVEAFLKNVMQGYNETLDNLRSDSVVIPSKKPDMVDWAEGFIIAFELTAHHWPKKAMNKHTKSMLGLLDKLADGEILIQDQKDDINAWIRKLAQS